MINKNSWYIYKILRTLYLEYNIGHPLSLSLYYTYQIMIFPLLFLIFVFPTKSLKMEDKVSELVSLFKQSTVSTCTIVSYGKDTRLVKLRRYTVKYYDKYSDKLRDYRQLDFRNWLKELFWKLHLINVTFSSWGRSTFCSRSPSLRWHQKCSVSIRWSPSSPLREKQNNLL